MLYATTSVPAVTSKAIVVIVVATVEAALAWVTATLAVPTPMTPTIPATHGDKPEKLKGLDFKTWQQKMLLYLTILV